MRARDVNHGAHASSSAPSPVAGRAATKRRSIRRTGHLNVRPWLGRNLPGVLFVCVARRKTSHGGGHS
eukprot:3627189-Pyramimonas_sp.AAC.1